MSLKQDDFKKLLIELERREKKDLVTFDKQEEFITHTGRLKAALTSRRAGKTYGCAEYLWRIASENPGCNCAYIALTRDSAEGIIWKILKEVTKRHGWKVAKSSAERYDNETVFFQNVKLRCEFSNGSVVYLYGADKKGWSERVLGHKFKLIIIDEAASYGIDMSDLVYSKLVPTTLDEDGAICLIGTPQDVLTGLFFEVTNGMHGEKQKEWSLFKWHTTDNIYPTHKPMCNQWHKYIANKSEEWKALPESRRDYYGEWAHSDNNLVYSLNEKNIIDVVPDGTNLTNYVLGVDFGWSDYTAFSICAWGNSNSLYVLESAAEKKLDVEKVAEKIKQYQARFRDLRIVADPANMMIFETIRARYSIPIIKAEKANKADWIECLNSDFNNDKMFIVRSANEFLIKQMYELAKAYVPGGWKEDHTCHNDLCDTVLYAHRHSFHYRYKNPVIEPEPYSKEYFEKEINEYWENAAHKKNKNRWWECQ